MTNPAEIKEKDVELERLNAESHPQFMGHERVIKISAPQHDFTAIVGIHNTALGPALGGIRYKYYESENDALSDALRLSEAMTWKNAAGGLKHGGGKTVIMASDISARRPSQIDLQLLAAGLNQINKDGALYYGAQDMNLSEEALDYVASIAPWIKGTTSDDPNIVGGTPSPITAIGVYECIKIAAKEKLGKDSLEDVRIAMQGLGSVGADMARHLAKDGAILIGCDMADEPFKELDAEGIHVQRVTLNEIYDVKADIFAPNAIGGTLNDENIQRLKNAGVKIVCGAANNQQADQVGGSQSALLKSLDILYCPDYIVNAGGVIWVAKTGEPHQQTLNDIREGVPRRFKEVLDLQKQNPDRDMASIASMYAQRRVKDAEHASKDFKSDQAVSH